MYGPPGSGKTFTTLLFAEGLASERGKRIAYVDTERGTSFYAIPVEERDVHPEAFDFDALYTRSIADVTQAVRGLSSDEYGVVVIDSITHLWQAAMDAYEGKQTKADTIPMHAWGKIKKPYKELIDYLMAAPFDVFILGRQKNLFESSPTDPDSIRKVGVGMRAEGETEYEPHLCFRMEGRKDQRDSTRTLNYCYVEKDRTGILAGRSYVNPDFSILRPIMALFGTEQAPSEDEDERIAKDAELLEAQEQKKRDKATKSAGILADMNAKLVATTSLEELAATAGEVKKLKRSMTAEHVAALQEVYKQRRADLTDAIAKGAL